MCVMFPVCELEHVLRQINLIKSPAEVLIPVLESAALCGSEFRLQHLKSKARYSCVNIYK